MSAKPMKIACLITDLDVGGAEQNLEALARALASRGHHVAVASLMPPGSVGERLVRSGIRVTDLHMTSRLDLRVIGRLTGWLRRERPDVLHTWLFHANLLGRIAGTLCRVRPVVSSIRVAEPRCWHLLLERLTQRLAGRIVVNSEGLMDFMAERGIVPGQMICIPNSVDSSRFRTEPRTPGGPTTALFVGRLDRQKGVDILLEAAPRLPEMRFLIAGDGPERTRLEEAAKDSPNVSFLGFREDVPELLAASDMLVLPSRWEGLPNVLLEAMSAGRPVVATEVTGSRDLIRSGVNGLLVPPDDPVALAAAIATIGGDPELAARLRRGGLSTVHSHEPGAIAATYEALYRSLLD